MLEEEVVAGDGAAAGLEGDSEAAAKAAVEGVIQSGAARESSLPEELRHLPERDRAQAIELKRKSAELEHGLKKTYATWILVLLGFQLALANAIFVAFAWVGEGWDLSTPVIQAWLAATVVQIVGVVLVVTRHLFPNRDGKP
jgi:hypothetical protein